MRRRTFARRRPARFGRRALLRILTGLAVLVAAPTPARAAATPRVRRCPERECGHLYDPAIGEPSQGIPPGIAFEDLPDDWECPECATPKSLW